MGKKLLIYFFVFFFGAALISYFVVPAPKNASVTVAKITTNGGTDEVVSNEPKTEACPLNGALYSQTNRNKWEKRRPLGIMVENSVDARPQSGLSNADVIFEAVAEGGITRFLALFYCNPPKLVGPVRSARVYFIDMVGMFGESPLYAHVGGANTPGPANAIGQLEDMGWTNYNDLNQFSIGFPVFWRDAERLPGVATEHTMYTNPEKLWAIAAKRGLTNVDKEGVKWDESFTPWTFKKETPAKTPTAKVVSYEFWDKYSDFDVTWTYDAATNSYLRTNGGKKHLDKNTGKQIAAKNVVILFMDESVANDGYDQGQHMLYGTKGTGKAIIIMDGAATNGTWSKKDRFSPLVLKDTTGKSIEFNPGLIWFSIIPTGNKVTIE